jgi:hypothetical protein
VISSSQTPAYRDGVAYLQQVQLLLPDPRMIDVLQNVRDRVLICNWIGDQIELVNRSLQANVQACHECFDPVVRQSINIFAVPFASSVPLDGFCNITTVPTTILIDAGRVAPADWLAVVVHEYAHAHVGHPGHDRAYAQVLSHLCLGLGFRQPSMISNDQSLYSWPIYSSVLDPLAWWRGEEEPDSKSLSLKERGLG